MGQMTSWVRNGLTMCLVVPVFNEEVRVGESFEQLSSFIEAAPTGSVLVFVDDGSTDRTTEVVEGCMARHQGTNITLLRRPHAGKGGAVRAGLQLANTDLAGFCDVDLATPLDQLDLVVDAAAADHCLAIGSRAVVDAEIGRHERRRRELAGKAFNRLVRLICGKVADTQCGAKAAPTEIWRAILPYSREDRFAWDVETIALARRLSVPVQELGVRWSHDERTRVKVVRDGLAMVWAVPRIALRVRLAPTAAGRADLRASVHQTNWTWAALRPSASLAAHYESLPGGRVLGRPGHRGGDGTEVVMPTIALDEA
jgi:dolichyl-phosphate beta-glucosyltransferase